MENIPQINTQEKEVKPFFPVREFNFKVNNQFEKTTNEPYTKKDGTVVEIKYCRLREDASELVEKLALFLETIENAYKQYWKTEISKTGSQVHSKEIHTSDGIEELRKNPGAFRSGEIMGHIKTDLLMAFDLYTCVKEVKPDRIITLVNGAVILDSFSQALGLDSQNYLSLHRKTTDDEDRKEMTPVPIYEGKPIVPGSTVLILEDTSSLGEERTYAEARAWLANQGVTNAPVFFHHVAELSQTWIDLKKPTSEQTIKIQETCRFCG